MTEPTDKQLEDFAVEEQFLLFCDVDEFTQIARAVLAKWGMLRADRIVVPTDTMEQELQKHYQRGYAAGQKASATQPTQAQAGAVPQRWKAVPVNPTPEMWKAAKSVPDPNPPYPPHYGLVWDAMLAASPTPPAEQQAAPKAAPAPWGGADWQDISTAPKDGTRFVAVGQNYGLDSEAQHTCIAQWLAGCWVEVSDWNGASKLKYLTHWMPLPPLPCSAGRAPADSVGRDAERWRTFIGLPYEIRAEWAANLSLVPVLTQWVDQAAIDAAMAANGGNK